MRNLKNKQEQNRGGSQVTSFTSTEEFRNDLISYVKGTNYSLAGFIRQAIEEKMERMDTERRVKEAERGVTTERPATDIQPETGAKKEEPQITKYATDSKSKRVVKSPKAAPGDHTNPQRPKNKPASPT